jgi:Tfp pilus assembly protein PilF
MRTVAIVILVVLAGCASSGNNVNNSKMAEGYYMKGLSHLQEKNYELAGVEFNRSIQTDSSNKNSYYALGLISDMQGKLEDAAKYYGKAIDIDSDFSEAHNALGVVYFKQQKWKDAIKSFKKALANKLYTTSHLPYLNMGDLYMAQKEYAKAAEAYQESKRFANLELTVYKLGNALYEAGKIKEAINEFQEGVGLSPKNASMRYGLATALLKDGNKKAAIAEFKKTVELAPQSELAQQARDYIKTLR